MSHNEKYPGIDYTPDTIARLENNLSLLAGMMNLPTTKDMMVLLMTEPCKSICDSMIRERSNNYGLPKTAGGKNLLYKAERVYSYRTETRWHHLIFRSNMPELPYPDQFNAVEITHEFPNILYGWHAVKLVGAMPDHFPHCSVDIGSPQLDAYSWFKAIKLLQHVLRRVSKLGKLGKLEESISRGKPAQQPEYMATTRAADYGDAVIHTDDDGDDDYEIASLSAIIDEVQEILDVNWRPKQDELDSQATKLSAAVGKALTGQQEETPPPQRRSVDCFRRQQAIEGLMKLHRWAQDCILGQRNVSALITNVAWITSTAEAAVTNVDPDIFRKSIKTDDPDELDNALQAAEAAQLSLFQLAGAKGPCYDEAREQLSGIKNLQTEILKPWQLTGAAWMVAQEQGPIRGGILADACGLGKTTTALTMLVARSHTSRAPYRPTLVLTPANALHVWIEEAEARFKGQITIRLFHGAKNHTGNSWRKAAILDNEAELVEYLRSRPPCDPATARIVVLSTYNTWNHRMVRVVGNESRVIPKATRPTETSEDPEWFGEEEEEEEEDENEEPDEVVELREFADGPDSPEMLKSTQSPFDPATRRAVNEIARFQELGSVGTGVVTTSAHGLFGRVICDEGHFVKAIQSKAHQAVRALDAQHIWVLSATPLCNKITDLSGYAVLLWPKIASNNLKDDNDPLAENITSAKSNRFANVSLLDPKRLVRIIRRGNQNNNEREGTHIADHVLPAVLRLIAISRSMGDKMLVDGSELIIGDNIPLMRITTIDIRFPAEMQKEYDDFHKTLASRLTRCPNMTACDNDQDSADCFDWGALRLTCLASFSPRILELFRTRSGGESGNETATGNIQSRVERGDKGFSFFYKHTRKDPVFLPPTDRAEVALYLAYDSPRLRLLAKILNDEGCFASGTMTPRLLVVCSWPLTLWMTEMFLDALGVRHRVIRAEMTHEARVAAAEDFNNPQSEVQVLLATYAVGVLGLNLHHACSRAVLLEPAINISTFFQTVGRLHRIDQHEPQQVWIAFQEHSIDRWLENNTTNKAISRFAAGLTTVGSGHAAVEIIKQQNDDNEEQSLMLTQRDGDSTRLVLDNFETRKNEGAIEVEIDMSQTDSSSSTRSATPEQFEQEEEQAAGLSAVSEEVTEQGGGSGTTFEGTTRTIQQPRGQKRKERPIDDEAEGPSAVPDEITLRKPKRLQIGAPANPLSQPRSERLIRKAAWR